MLSLAVGCEVLSRVNSICTEAYIQRHGHRRKGHVTRMMYKTNKQMLKSELYQGKYRQCKTKNCFRYFIIIYFHYFISLKVCMVDDSNGEVNTFNKKRWRSTNQKVEKIFAKHQSFHGKLQADGQKDSNLRLKYTVICMFGM